jgi:hypothetical protein
VGTSVLAAARAIAAKVRRRRDIPRAYPRGGRPWRDGPLSCTKETRSTCR